MSVCSKIACLFVPKSFPGAFLQLPSRILRWNLAGSRRGTWNWWEKSKNPNIQNGGYKMAVFMEIPIFPHIELTWHPIDFIFFINYLWICWKDPAIQKNASDPWGPTQKAQTWFARFFSPSEKLFFLKRTHIVFLP